jgi:hypothetical protein
MLTNENIEEGNNSSLIGKKRTRKLRACMKDYGKTEQKLNNYRKNKKMETKLKKLKNLENPIKICTTVYPTENDFINPIAYLENLWNSNKDSTGIIKIIPPESWKITNSYIFENFYYPNFLRSDKKIETRIQILGSLMKGKVN